MVWFLHKKGYQVPTERNGQPMRAALVLLCLLSHAEAGASLPRSRAGQFIERAGRSAASTAGSLGAVLSSTVKGSLDADGDGEVSVEDLESAVRGMYERCSRVAGRCYRLFVRQRDLCLSAAAVLGLIYGKYLAHTILFLQVFSSSGWPLARNGVKRAIAAYEKAKARLPRDLSRVAPLRAELEELSAEVGAH